jgi:GAF domain-containing protein
MWNWLVNATTNLRLYTEPSRHTRAAIAYGVVYLFLALFSLYAFTVPFAATDRGETEAFTYVSRAIQPNQFPIYTIAFFGFYVLALFTLVRLGRGHLESVTFGPSAMIYIGGGSIAIINNLAYSQNGLIMIVAVLVAALLDEERGLVTAVPLHFGLTILGYTLYLGQTPVNIILNLVLILIVSVGIFGVSLLNLRLGRITINEILDDLTRQRLQIAQLTTRITRSISTAEQVETALDEVIYDIRDTFPQAYHVQVFLLDDTGRVAQLVASTGEAGRQLLENRHSLPVGSSSVIGYVTQQQRAYRTVVGAEEAVHRPNPYLPDTRLEVALPLKIGTRTIGALDLQSTDPQAFPPTELTTLQAIADSMAVTINSAQLLTATQRNLAENQRLVEQTQVAQREVERLNRELTGTIWADYLRGQSGDYNLDLDFVDGQLSSSDDLTEAIMDAIRNDDVVRRTDADGRQIVAVPLRVRGEVIGAMEFEVESEMSSTDVDMLREVGERFGLAAENNRLYETSQRVAQREVLVNEINTRIQSANSIDATVAEAARGLRDALKAKRVAIKIGTLPPSQPTNGHKE